MYTINIPYDDYNGEARTEEACFNLTLAELSKWENSIDGGLSARILKIQKTQNVPEMMALMDEIIDKSYGVKDATGRKFLKSPEILADFKSTEAYSNFFMDVTHDASVATEFINKIIPANLEEKLKKYENNAPKGFNSTLRNALEKENAVNMPANG